VTACVVAVAFRGRAGGDRVEACDGPMTVFEDAVGGWPRSGRARGDVGIVVYVEEGREGGC